MLKSPSKAKTSSASRFFRRCNETVGPNPPSGAFRLPAIARGRQPHGVFQPQKGEMLVSPTTSGNHRVHGKKNLPGSRNTRTVRGSNSYKNQGRTKRQPRPSLNAVLAPLLTASLGRLQAPAEQRLHPAQKVTVPERSCFFSAICDCLPANFLRTGERRILLGNAHAWTFITGHGAVYALPPISGGGKLLGSPQSDRGGLDDAGGGRGVHRRGEIGAG